MAGMYGCFKSRNENAAMASGPPDVMANREPAEVEECSGKKKSKFQTFKKFFTRRKRKEPLTYSGEAGLKASQSSDNINRTPENTLTRSEKEKGSGSKVSLGCKALSHDSVFVSDSSEAAEALATSQDSIHGKVKSLQLQLQQTIRLGTPPTIIRVKSDDVGAMSEDDGLPCSPLELHTLHTVLNPVQRNGSLSMEGTDSDEDQLPCAGSSRAVSPLLVVPGDFSQPASPYACLDNSAAKHKLVLRHKACTRRRPTNRLEVRGEEDSVNEGRFNTSVQEQLEERLEQENGDVHGDLLAPKKESGGEEELEDQAQHDKQSLLGDPQEDKEEMWAGQDVSHAPDVSSPSGCNGEEGFPAEEEPPLSPASSQRSSTVPSLDGNRATPEPPSGDREKILDRPGSACGNGEDNSELVLETDITDEEAGENAGEESSFLQEVLSSLKTPLNAYSLSLEREEEPRGVGEEVKVDEPEESVGEEQEVMASGRHVPFCEALERAEEEQDDEEEDAENGERLTQNSNKEEVQEVRSEYCTNEEEEEKEMEEELDLGRQREEGGQEGETEEASEGEEVASEGEEVAVELEKDSEAVEGGAREKTREDEEAVEVADEALEEWGDEWMEEAEEGEDLAEAFPHVAEHVGQSGALELSERDAQLTPVVEALPLSPAHPTPVLEALPLSPAHIPVELCEEPLSPVEMDTTEPAYDVEMEHVDVEPSAEQDQTERSDPNADAFEPRSVAGEPDGDLGTQEEGGTEAAGPSASQQASSSLQQCASEADAIEEENQSFAARNAEEHEPVQPEVTTEEEGGGELVEKQSADAVATTEEESRRPSSPPATEEETVTQPDQSRPRYTIAPAWQRSLSAGSGTKEVTPPSSPTLGLSSTGPSGPASPVRPTMAQAVCTSRAEVVLSPSRHRSAGAFPAKPPGSSAVPAEETQGIAEGNPENPFGVRLRKTSVLRNCSSEEDNTEPTYESQVQPEGSRSAPVQPISIKPTLSQPIGVRPTLSQPIGVKPALPKRPEGQGESGEKPKPTPGQTGPGGSDSPSWISVARQKQWMYKDNTSTKKEEPETKPSLPLYVSSATCREPGKTMESSGVLKGSSQETASPAGAAEQGVRRALSPPTPVPPQVPKTQVHMCPDTPRPSTQPAPAPVSQRGSIIANPPPFNKSPLPHPGSLPSKAPLGPQPPSAATHLTPSQPGPTLASTTFPPRNPSASATQSGANTSRAPGLSGSGQRGLPASGSPTKALPQDEPPWMALAKKKAKAWSEMPQIVQ